MSQPSVFIIGAGIAGLSCARVLSDAGIEVRLADKGRGPGGRCSTRRSPAGSFDHGAAYFTARDPQFRQRVQEWARAGAAAPWSPRLAHDGDRKDAGDDWFVGTPGMNAIVRLEAERLGAEFGLKIGFPREGQDGRFDLRTEAGHQIADADFVVVAVPAPQAATLLPDDSPLKRPAEDAGLAPCWTLMAAFGEKAADPGFDVAKPVGGAADAVFWQPGKPEREGASRFVLHATPEWSRAHLEDDPDTVSGALLQELSGLVPDLPPAEHSAVHRWRYARVEDPAPGDYGLDLEGGFATCGDWHIAPRIEAAWLSGHRLGEALRAEL